MRIGCINEQPVAIADFNSRLFRRCFYVIGNTESAVILRFLRAQFFCCRDVIGVEWPKFSLGDGPRLCAGERITIYNRIILEFCDELPALHRIAYDSFSVHRTRIDKLLNKIIRRERFAGGVRDHDTPPYYIARTENLGFQVVADPDLTYVIYTIV